jgi:UDP:flavonoid glycosyltransferase YjiC (YdhE family)
MRALIVTGGSAGHVFPGLTLAAGLRDRGNEVTLATASRWREMAEERSLGFFAADRTADVELHESWQGWAADAARELLPEIERFEPDVVVGDVVTPGPGLAAQVAGARWSTLMPVLYPADSPGMPAYPFGMLPPRTRAGTAMWRAARGPLRALHPRNRWLREVPAQLNDARRDLGLPPLDRIPGGWHDYGPISDGLVLVATLPQLEYPRAWPDRVHVVGPMLAEHPGEEIELPPGADPLVFVAASTTMDPGLRLVEMALDALADEPVRVVATTGERGWAGEVPANAAVTDWASNEQLLSQASLVVARGGHGTVVRSLSSGVPLLVFPAGTDMAENGARVTWAGAGTMVPRPLQSPIALRLAVRRMLSEPRFAAAAGRLAAWARGNDAAARGAALVEDYARDGGDGAAPR